MAEILLQVENLSKRFCRDLKRSLWYGVRDIAGEFVPRSLRSSGEAPRCRSGEFWALNDVSFELRRGECLGLIGGNGAGKSTLLKLISGLIKPDGGAIRRRGRLGALIELGAGFNPVLTGRENIYVNAAVLGLTRTETRARFDQIVDFADIGDALDAPVQTYSSGMKVRLGFAIASNLEPDILLIDEVLAVGDAAFRMKCIAKVRENLAQGVGAVFVSHDAIALQRICSSGLLLKRGHADYHGALLETLHRHEAQAGDVFETVAITEHSRRGHALEDFVFRLQLKRERAFPARLLIRIDSPQNGPIWGRTFLFHHDPANPEITVTLARLPLMDGNYSVFFALYGESDEDLIEQGYLFSFLVEGAPKSYFARGAVGVLNSPIEFARPTVQLL